jgi:hydroxymethylbilane synthase
MSSLLRIGTRGSVLARWQANWCLEQLKLYGTPAEIIIIQTSGDLIQDSSIIDIGSQGIFTKEIQRALLHNKIDTAVHSLKDLPTDQIEGLELSAVPQRGSCFDAFISTNYTSLDDLPIGSRIGTGSLRRQTQIINKYNNKFVIDGIRGNVETRLRKLDADEYDAIILAEAGLERLGFKERIGSILKPPLFLPAAGQGAIGLEIRSDDHKTAAKIKPLCDPITFKSIIAERTMLQKLKGGCIMPIGALCTTNNKKLSLHGRILSIDGQKMIETIKTIPINADPESLGIMTAEELINQGANKIMQEITKKRINEY